jgi:hypothetical protein
LTKHEDADSQTRPSNDRPVRVISHALVEMRRHKWLPFGVSSAVLLDMSTTGFKVEFTGSVQCAIGDKFIMQIPLAPFGIKVPASVSCPVIVKWFDPDKMRVGGTFEDPSKAAQIYLDQIIEKVKIHGLAE